MGEKAFVNKILVIMIVLFGLFLLAMTIWKLSW